jgi:hypothetical protein
MNHQSWMNLLSGHLFHHKLSFDFLGGENNYFPVFMQAILLAPLCEEEWADYTSVCIGSSITLMQILFRSITKEL